MRPRSALFEDQRLAAAEIVRRRQVAVFLEPGRGKTAATLTALCDLGKFRTLVLAPARVADTVWHAEAAEWEHLRRLRVLPATGDQAQRRGVLESGCDVVVLSYDNFPWLLSRYDASQFFDAVVFDELDYMKSADAVRFRRFRGSVRHIPVRVGLTGTPVGNHLLDLWAEMYMVAGEKPLGPTKGEYVARYFAPGAVVNGRVVTWTPHAYAQREIEQRVRPYAFTLPPSPDAPRLPEVRVKTVALRLPARVEEQMDELHESFKTELDSGEELFTYTSAAASVKLRQMASGAVYHSPPDALGAPPPEKRTWEAVHAEKLLALQDLVGELQGEPLLVFYWFQHERDRLLAHFQGKARELDGAAAIAAWNRREVEVLLAHPASAGHGLNLQGGGHHAYWYTLPESLTKWMQGNGRLARHGQRSPVVFAHVPVAGRVDRRAVDRISRKDAVQAQLLEATRL